ncbi:MULTISPECIES: flagellar protein FlgN [Cupriavidus]|uniref:Flagellar protein FlgN n=1 Tax=Cupriavidus oxalaticus TaxID=96344 RepID=A0A4P7LAI6_9BURK|nr:MULTISPECIES: flagellar protein FlgN [Cupriavidus]MBF6988349.1 flagellar protein FlgN [Cupriavidus sp. IK-TO18]QBY50949.1 flagellar protein FlgN [Cupriavidus oxalaticus]
MSQSLIQSLQRETEGVEAFGQLLAQERDAIKRGDFTALSELLTRKVEVGQGLSRQVRAREAQMQALGLRAGADGQLLGRLDAGVAEAWRKLIFAARVTRDGNALNGAVIKAHLDFTQQAIQALRQHSGGDAGLYGKDGKAATGVGGVSLAAG